MNKLLLDRLTAADAELAEAMRIAVTAAGRSAIREAQKLIEQACDFEGIGIAHA